MSETENNALLDLASPRIVVLVEGERSYNFICRRITDKDWTAFFNSIRITNETKGREQIQVRDFAAAPVALAEAVIERAEGYTVSDGRGLTELPNWKRRIPLAHRLMVGSVLSSARVSVPSGDFEIVPDGEVISLDCTWSANEDLSAMVRIAGLKHIFDPPTEQHFRRYQDQASRTIVVGGSRGGKTIYPGAAPLLAKLYDELIVGVSGYSYVGMSESPMRDVIIREMDMHHKVMAAQELFEPRSGVRVAGEAEAQEVEA